jgi:hypothetical protein
MMNEEGTSLILSYGGPLPALMMSLWNTAAALLQYYMLMIAVVKDRNLFSAAQVMDLPSLIIAEKLPQVKLFTHESVIWPQPAAAAAAPSR